MVVLYSGANPARWNCAIDCKKGFFKTWCGNYWGNYKLSENVRNLLIYTESKFLHTASPTTLSLPVSVSDGKVITEDSDKLYTLRERAEQEAALLYTQK